MRHIHQKWVMISTVFLLLFTHISIAVAQASSVESTLSESKKAEALGHFQKGQARYGEGEYLLAIEHFKSAYDITQSPEILYNIAMCYEEQKENEQAVAHYREYLKVANGDDAEEVKRKIKLLGGSPAEVDLQKEAEKKPNVKAEPAEASGSQKSERLNHFAFELGIGPGFVLLAPDTHVGYSGVAEPETRNYLSIDALGHFFMNDWFAITAGLLIGPYIEGDTKFIPGDPTSHLGLGIGIGMKKKVQTRASIFTNLMAAPCAIWRKSQSRRAMWMAFDFRFGINIHLTPKLDVNLMAVAEGGPTFVISPSSTQDWENGILLSVGPRIGFTYNHPKK